MDTPGWVSHVWHGGSMCECYLQRLHGAEEGAFRKGQNFYSESGKGQWSYAQMPLISADDQEAPCNKRTLGI